MPETLTLQEVIRRSQEARLGELHTALPGTVVSYDAATQLADVRPGVARPMHTVDGDLVHEELPVIPNVPVMWPRAGGYFLSFPLVPGDDVLLVVCEASIDAWRYSSPTGSAPLPRPADPTAIIAHGASDAAPQTLAADDLDGAIGGGAISPPARVTARFATHEHWTGGNLTIEGEAEGGAPLAETIPIPGGGATATKYQVVTDVLVPAQGGGAGTFTVGLEGQSPGQVQPGDERRHHLSHAVAIPGLFRHRAELADVSTNHLVLGRDEGAQVHVREAEIRLGSDAAVSYVALATLVNAELAKISATLASVTGGSGSPVTFGTPYVRADVDATKVKAE